MTYDYLRNLLRPRLKGFSDTEKIIAEYFIQLGNNVVNKTLSNISEDIGVSESTIFKFVKKIGFEGFQDFKITVASNFRTNEERSQEIVVFPDISKSDSPYVIAQKIVNSNKGLLEHLLHSLNEEQLNQALNLIYPAKCIHFFGQGASSVIALDTYHKFLRTKFHCNYVSDLHMQLSYATKLGPDDCVFLFSHSGETFETIQIAKILRNNQAKIIALTGNYDSELVKLSDTSFVVYSEESAFRSETLTARILYLTLIDILYVSVMYHDEEKNKKSLENIRKALYITKKRGVQE
ncbi:MurR/RpiR family transcriptional regulator [Caldifermentibacillus hisashii]|uniref:MurR/RpiR family transcriptional regulator n=1 Tax=Caldifermentibacillus hisashii TaxID=996558 RepID=UPI001C110633|nr:MurR/RpiR family transcriptional regulator [Caldifermentibacillus hisashii]MBU5343391.1 MurR/RpiR family transcriptional regulator [Caldifermentibacillus hisashii]